MERSFGSFARTIPLPADADPDRVTADYKNGVITVKIPKRRAAPTSQRPGTKIEVK